MNKNVSVLSSLLIAVAVVCLAQVVVAQNAGVLAKAQSVSGDRFTVAVRTPRGAAVYAVKRPAAAVLNAIDKGLTDLFAVSRRNGYRNRLNYADYTIYIAKADRTRNADGQYSPDFAVGSAQYAGSVYDQGGYIYAAGMVIANSPASFMIAKHSRNFARISEFVRYEGVHLVLYHNDRRRYNQTADHSRGGGHPILQ